MASDTTSASERVAEPGYSGLTSATAALSFKGKPQGGEEAEAEGEVNACELHTHTQIPGHLLLFE